RRACRSAFRGQIGEDMPALVVVLGGKWPVCAAAPWAPAGAAVYALRRDHAFAALPMIIDNIAPGCPLERASKDATPGRAGARRGSLLLIDRDANNARRLGDAIEMARIDRARAGLPPLKEWIADLWQLASELDASGDVPHVPGQRLVDINIMRPVYRED